LQVLDASQVCPELSIGQCDWYVWMALYASKDGVEEKGELSFSVMLNKLFLPASAFPATSGLGLVVSSFGFPLLLVVLHPSRANDVV